MYKVLAFMVYAIALCGADYSKSQKDKLNIAADLCQKELNLPLSDNHHLRAQSGDVTSADPMYKTYVACYMRQLDIVDEKGKIKPQILINFLVEGHDKQLLKEAVDACADTVDGETPDDRAFNFHICFWSAKRFDM